MAKISPDREKLFQELAGSEKFTPEMTPDEILRELIDDTPVHLPCVEHDGCAGIEICWHRDSESVFKYEDVIGLVKRLREELAKEAKNGTV